MLSSKKLKQIRDLHKSALPVHEPQPDNSSFQHAGSKHSGPIAKSQLEGSFYEYILSPQGMRDKSYGTGQLSNERKDL
jgi:hypothetical protein